MQRAKPDKQKAVYSSRVKRLRRLMKSGRVEAFLVTELTNVRYLSGFTGSSGSLLVQPNRVVFISDSRYEEQAGREVAADEISILIGGDLTGRILKYVKRLKLKRLGVESRSLSHWQYRALEDTLGSNCRIAPIEDWVESLRRVKDPVELKRMSKAARIGDRAFKKVLCEIREGMTELELSRLLRNALETFGGGKQSFDAIVLFGGRASIIHGQPGKARLKKGQLILMDFGTTYQGYCSDMTRTVAFGQPSAEVRNAYEALRRAQRETVRAVRAGRKCSAVDAVARRSLESAGCGELFIHATGHSLGLDIHESPRLSDQSSDVLRPDMVITIEPGVYRPGKFGIRIEDMVRVTKDDAELLTRSPRRLVVL